jgi:hypothetical protein
MDTAVAGQRGDRRIGKAAAGRRFRAQAAWAANADGFDAPFLAWAVVRETEIVSRFEASRTQGMTGFAPNGKRRLLTTHTPLQPKARRRMSRFRCYLADIRSL